MAAPRYQGERVDIGGRHLRVTRAGPVSGGPLIVCEHGAYGSATDWAVVQALLAARGRRSLAYDRAGLGYSDPGPEPRDGRAINDDLEALLEALGETAPILLVGHSMGGLMVRLFALERTRALVGLVLVDAVTPDVLGLPGVAPGVQVFGRLLQVVSRGAKAGLMHPVSWVAGNPIELPGEAGAEKRRIHASASHAHGAAAEVLCWPETSRMAGAAAGVATATSYSSIAIGPRRQGSRPYAFDAHGGHTLGSLPVSRACREARCARHGSTRPVVQQVEEGRYLHKSQVVSA